MSLKLETRKQSKYNSVTYQMETPDGNMYVNIMEDSDNKICAIDISIGKSGTSLRAWCNTTSRLITLMLECGVPIYSILEQLSNQTTDRSTFLKEGKRVRSAVEGVFIILTKYQSDKIAIEDTGDRKSVGYFKNRKRA